MSRFQDSKDGEIAYLSKWQLYYLIHHILPDIHGYFSIIMMYSSFVTFPVQFKLDQIRSIWIRATSSMSISRYKSVNVILLHHKYKDISSLNDEYWMKYTVKYLVVLKNTWLKVKNRSLNIISASQINIIII